MNLNAKHDNWLMQMQELIRDTGYAVIENVLGSPDLKICYTSLYSARDRIICEIGKEKLKRANEYGVLRIMMKYEPYFLTLLTNPYLLAIIDATVSNTAILHLQNGFILPSFSEGQTPQNFQNNFHRDFPRYMNGYLASINVLLAIDEFTPNNGGTMIVPNTHQKAHPPVKEYIERNAIAVECPAGSAIIFDSTLWHASGINTSGKDRLAINHQFTRSFFKQQIDYVRALGEDMITKLPERTQQLLGYYTRVPTSLDEYYKTEAERLYKKGQG